jgi:hypothetical protein
MTYFITVDTTTKAITGLYSDDLGSPPLPINAIKISDSDAALIKQKFGSYILLDGVITLNPYVKPNSQGYAQLRANAYPPISDYIDGVVKGDQAQVQAYIDACNAVKVKYPKTLPAPAPTPESIQAYQDEMAKITAGLKSTGTPVDLNNLQRKF